MKLSEILAQRSKTAGQSLSQKKFYLLRKKEISEKEISSFEIEKNFSKDFCEMVVFAIKRGLAFEAAFVTKEGAFGLEVLDRFVKGFGKVFQSVSQNPIEIPIARILIVCGKIEGKKAVFLKRKTSQILVKEN